MAEELNTIDDLTDDYNRLRAQKSRHTGSVEARMLTNIAFLSGEQWLGSNNRTLYTRRKDPNKLHLVFNLTNQIFSKMLGRLTTIAGHYYAKPDKRDPKSLAQAEVVDKLLLAIDQKVDEDMRDWERKWWLGVCGVAFEYVPWIPDAAQEPMPVFDETSGELMWQDTQSEQPVPESLRLIAIEQGVPPERFEVMEEMRTAGDVGSEVISPLQVFVDSSVRSIADLAPDQAVYIAKIRTMGWIEENYPEVDAESLTKAAENKDVKIISTDLKQYGDPTGAMHLQDLVPRIQGSVSKDDPDMAVVVERFQPTSSKYPHGRYTVFIPGEVVLLDEDNPYEEIPLVDYHWNPVTTTFWSQDYISDLIAPQRFLNKRLSQMGEQANASVYAAELLGPGLKPSDVPADYPAPIENAVTDTGVKLVQRREPPQFPGWFMQSMDLVVKLMREMAGGVVLFENQKFPGQMRGSMSIPMLQEILDSQWGHLYQHIGERTSRVKQMRINRVKQFYPPYRTLHYTSTNQRDEVFTFHTSDVLRAGTEYNITVERGSLMPELRALREDRVARRLEQFPFLYTDERTGQIDSSKVASDLAYGDQARESSEAQLRKLTAELIEKLWQGEPIPEVLPMPFWNMQVFMDEMEASMTTTEFLSASPQVQQGFLDVWNRAQEMRTQAAERRQEAGNDQQVQQAVAQAAQQAAAKAAASAIDMAMEQMQVSQQQTAQAPDMLAQALAQQRQQP